MVMKKINMIKIKITDEDNNPIIKGCYTRKKAKSILEQLKEKYS